MRDLLAIFAALALVIAVMAGSIALAPKRDLSKPCTSIGGAIKVACR